MQALDFCKKHSEKRKKLYQNLMIYKMLKMLCCISNTISCNCLKIHNRTGRTATTLEIDKKYLLLKVVNKSIICNLFKSFTDSREKTCQVVFFRHKYQIYE